MDRVDGFMVIYYYVNFYYVYFYYVYLLLCLFFMVFRVYGRVCACVVVVVDRVDGLMVIYYYVYFLLWLFIITFIFYGFQGLWFYGLGFM